MSFVGAIVGVRRSGKTSLALDLLLSVWRYRFDMIMIMSRTITLRAFSAQDDSGEEPAPAQKRRKISKPRQQKSKTSWLSWL